MGTAAGSAAAAAAAKVGSWTHTALAASTALLKFNCGLIGGITQAGMFNPWDRALYLSVKHSRPFLSLSNFSRPYQGFWQAIVQVCLCGVFDVCDDMRWDGMGWDGMRVWNFLFVLVACQEFSYQPTKSTTQNKPQRTLSTGLYFPLEDLFMQPCYETFDNKFLAAWMAGTLAGALNGVALNPASAIKCVLGCAFVCVCLCNTMFGRQ
jgi:hypothetical protein